MSRSCEPKAWQAAWQSPGLAPCPEIATSPKAPRNDSNVGAYLQVRPANVGRGLQACPDEKERLLTERELLSLDLSAHPLDFIKLDGSFTRIKDLPAVPTGHAVRIAGSVIRYQTPPTRTGKRVVYVILEDGTGVADVTVFSDVQEKCGRILFRACWMEVRGKIQRRGPKALSIIADEVKVLRGNPRSP